MRNQTGYSNGAERYADAVALNLWPSRGLEILGFEIKTYRGDWLKELKNPAKSSEIQKFCDRWWVVAGGRNVVQSEELPATWGLLVVHGTAKKRLVCIQEAPKLDPKPLDKAFILALLRRAAEFQEYLKSGKGDDKYQLGFQAGVESSTATKNHAVASLRQELDYLTWSVRSFEEASGVSLGANKWRYGDIGLAVRTVVKNLQYPVGYHEALRQSMRPLEACLNAMKALDKSFSLLEGGKYGP